MMLRESSRASDLRHNMADRSHIPTEAEFEKALTASIEASLARLPARRKTASWLVLSALPERMGNRRGRQSRDLALLHPFHQVWPIVPVRRGLLKVVGYTGVR